MLGGHGALDRRRFLFRCSRVVSPGRVTLRHYRLGDGIGTKKKKNYNKKTINRKLEGGARNQQATRSKVARMSEDRDRLATGGGVGVWALGFPNREDIRIRLITVGLSGRNMTKVWSRKYA